MIFLCVQGVLLATLVVLVNVHALHLFGMGDQGTAGLIMAVMMACASLMALALGRGIDRLPLRSILVLPSLIVLAIGFVVLAYTDTLLMAFLGAILVGGAYNGVTLPMLALLGDVTRSAEYGRAVGVYQVFGDVGGTLGPIVGLEAGTRLGLLPTYLGLAALFALACVVAVWVYRDERRTSKRRS